MKIAELIALIARAEDCRILPPGGLPSVALGHVIPTDVVEFYSLCGGAMLFESSAYGMSILPPQSFVWIDPIFYKGIESEVFRLDENNTPIYFVGEDEWLPGITSSWYAIADAQNGNYISIDCGVVDNGKCYPSFFDTHRVAGSCPVIAWSFTDVLEAMLRERGQYYFWLEPDFDDLGDAYDD